MSKTYIGQIVENVNGVTERCGPILLFGENIDTGSRISGLARGLTVNPQGRILNVGNCELTHVGVGMGMMLDRGLAALFMKQLDFLLLGVDQIVNTFNFARAFRRQEDLGSFTILVIVCDQGYQGVQSSFNAPADLASLANVDIYCLNAAGDAAHIINNQFVARGFRILCVSQRLFGAPALDLSVQFRTADNAIFKYRSGGDVTLACFNFSLRDTTTLAERLAQAGIESDLFHVNYVPAMDTSVLYESCQRTGALVLVDDSKSVAKFGDMLVAGARERGIRTAVLSLGRRGCASHEYGVTEDRFQPDFDTVCNFVQRAGIAGVASA